MGFQPPALSYGSKTAACPPQNPPTLPCSVQRFPAASNGLSSPRFPAASSGLFSRTFPATRFFLRLRGPRASSGISSQQLFLTVPRLPPAPLKTLPRFPAASNGLSSRTFPATRFFLRFRGPFRTLVPPVGLSHSSAMPPQNHPKLPAASRVSRPFQPAAASSGRFQPAALSYGSETAACPPQNPPTLPCSVQWPPTLPSSSQGRAAPGTTLGVELLPSEHPLQRPLKPFLAFQIC